MIHFNKPYMTGKELFNIAQAHFNGKLSGDGPFTKACHTWFENYTGTPKALLTHSCTGALEMSALLLHLEAGDEVIMPSYTFVSTANAFVLRGAVPVFVDIREDTLNIDEKLIEAAITPKTKAICVVHYAGVACEMDTIMAIAKKHKLFVVEDAAQAVMSFYKNKALGTFGDLGCYSFHETKNLISGEGGALLVNNKDFILEAEIIREKGTNRSGFFRGEVDKYTWQEQGSSYLPGELIAAFLEAQLQEAETITKHRLEIWENYHQELKNLASKHYLRQPIIPENCTHNAHMYYILLDSKFDRQEVLAKMKAKGILAVFHYVPLHSAPAGQRYCKVHGKLDKTNELSERLIRLPMYNDLSANDQGYIIKTFTEILTSLA